VIPYRVAKANKMTMKTIRKYRLINRELSIRFTPRLESLPASRMSAVERGLSDFFGTFSFLAILIVHKIIPNRQRITMA